MSGRCPRGSDELSEVQRWCFKTRYVQVPSLQAVRSETMVDGYRAPAGCSTVWANTAVSGPSEILKIGREKWVVETVKLRRLKQYGL